MQKLTYIYNDSYTISYSYREGKKTLMFLHGYLQAETVWHPFIKTLPPEYGIISVDLPGHGETSCFGEAYFSEFSKALAEIAEYHQVTSAHVIGHSMGGYMALQFLKDYNQKIITLSLLHSTPLPDTNERIRKRNREIAIIESGRINLVLAIPFDHLFAPQNRIRLAKYAQEYATLAQKVNAKAMVEAIRAMSKRGGFVTECATAAQPILLLAGKHDEMLSLSRLEECFRLLPQLEYHILGNCAHTCFIEEPQETKRILLNFLSTRG